MLPGLHAASAAAAASGSMSHRVIGEQPQRTGKTAKRALEGEPFA